MRSRLLLGFLAAVLSVLTLTVGVAYVDARGQAAEFAEVERSQRQVISEQRDGLLCVLRQLAEHRENSYAADMAAAGSGGYELHLPEPPPGAPAVGASVCRRFIQSIE